jgi:hypothetical protein
MSGEVETNCTYFQWVPRRYANTHRRHPSKDRLYNPETVLPQRPTITNLQWISGTQYVSPADMDILSK